MPQTLPRLHPRFHVLPRASLKIEAALAEIRKEFDLTAAEEVALLGDAISRLGHSLVSHERFPRT